MKTLKRVEIRPMFLDGFIPETQEEGILYISEKYNCAIHKCLCGCGQDSVTPLHPSNGWTLTKHEDGRVSLTPSILNNNCPNKSHYILTKNIANFV